MLGDPANLMLDEPINGLDPDGALWFRRFCRGLADQGCTVVISSHVMSELALMVDRVIILGRGKVIADRSLDSLTREQVLGVRVVSPDTPQLVGLLAAAGVDFERVGEAEVIARDADAAKIGDLAHAGSIRVHQLVTLFRDLEAVYLGITAGSVEYRSADVA